MSLINNSQVPSSRALGLKRLLGQRRTIAVMGCVLGAAVGVAAMQLGAAYLPSSDTVTATTRAAQLDRRLLHTVAANASPDAVQRPLLVAGLPDFTSLVDQVGPSVVNIRTTEKVRSSAGGSSQQNEQMLEFFKRFGIPVPPGFGGQPDSGDQPLDGEGAQRPRGIGSGFVLSADGYIMTNAHVVEGADSLMVTFPDQKEYPAKVIGSDKRTDVAVVKIDATGLKPVLLGDSDRLRVGEWVMAIGSPYGLENTVTAGIVSAKARETGDYLPFIQTDVAINPGNSGGPLINMRGEVVGINSQIYSRSGGFQGISFAIPIDEAVRVATQLRSQGFVSRGRIGVSIADVDEDTAQALGLGKPRGALVRGVEADSPASKAGVEPGDVVVEFDGKAVEKSRDLPRIVGNTKPNQRVRMTVVRRGAEKSLSIKVGEFEREEVAEAKTEEPTPQSTGAIKEAGLTVTNLSSKDKQSLRLTGGVRITEVTGAAARAGLQAGDIILTLDNKSIEDMGALETLLAATDKKKAMSVLFRRGQWAQYTLLRR